MSTVRRAKTKPHPKTKKRTIPLTVGILMTPHQEKTTHGTCHLMKSYVDWFEDRGIRVLPIPYDTPPLRECYSMIHGLLLPGGETTFLLKCKPYMKTVTAFIELSLEEGEYFPIWGTCFGFEAILSVIGGIRSFKSFVAHGRTPLHLTQEGRHSRMLEFFSKKERDSLEKEPSTVQNHEYGISPSEVKKNKSLSSFFRIVATATDETGKEYVAAMEGIDCPLYGVMWHPERQPNDASSQRLVEFFLRELRKHPKGHGLPYDMIPSIRSAMKPLPCTHYPELADEWCYYF